MWFMKVGNRVMGPFNEDEMRTKRLCKELASFHLVSSDMIRWENAEPLIKILDGAQPEWKRPQSPEPERFRERDGDQRQEFVPKPAVQWYYVDSARKQLGPVPQEILRDLLQTRRLSGRASVCKVGETQWEQARRYPELASAVPKRLERPAIIACSATLGVGLLAILGVMIGSSRSTAPSLTRSGGSAPTRVDYTSSLAPKVNQPPAGKSTSNTVFIPAPSSTVVNRSRAVPPTDAQVQNAIGKLIFAWFAQGVATSGDPEEDGIGDMLGRGIALGFREAAIQSAVKDLFGSLTASEQASACRIIRLLLEGRLTQDNYSRATRNDEITAALKREAPDLAGAVDVVDFLIMLDDARNKPR